METYQIYELNGGDYQVANQLLWDIQFTDLALAINIARRIYYANKNRYSKDYYVMVGDPEEDVVVEFLIHNEVEFIGPDNATAALDHISADWNAW
jgi:hypothetical protein